MNDFLAMWRELIAGFERRVERLESLIRTGNFTLPGSAVRGDIPAASVPAHASTHQNAGSDEISVAGLSGVLADAQTAAAHAASHQNGGGDEITVLGLSGLLADGQTPLAHKTSHESGGSDVPASFTGDSGAGGAVGYVPAPAAGDAAAGKFMKADGTWTVPPGGTDGDAIHDNVDGEIAAIAEKASPIAADLLVIEDSAAANAKKRAQVGNLPAMTGDAGAGGAKGYVPAPAAGDAAAGKYLKADGTWAVPGGSLGNHDHSGDAGDGGTFDAANLTSGAAGDGNVLTADGLGGAAWEAVAGGTFDWDGILKAQVFS